MARKKRKEGRLPRGLRNNNPLNIERTSTRWEGMAEVQKDGRFVTFETMAHGFRAAHRILRTYRDKHGLTTPRGIISRWAPPVENDTEAYVDFVSNEAGFDPEQEVDIGNADQADRFLRAMAVFENGREPVQRAVSSQDVRRGLELSGLARKSAGFSTPTTPRERPVVPPPPEKPEIVPRGAQPVPESVATTPFNVRQGDRVEGDFQFVDPLPEAGADVTLDEQLEAAIRRENVPVSVLDEALEPTPERGPPIDPREHLRADEMLMLPEFADAETLGEMQAIRRELDKERELRREIGEGPLPEIVATGLAVLTDPVSYLPVPGVRAGRALSAGVRVGLAGAATVGLSEAALQATQRTRTPEETMAAVLLGGTFGFGLGAAAARGEARAMARATEDLATIARAAEGKSRLPSAEDVRRLTPEELEEARLGSQVLREGETQPEVGAASARPDPADTELVSAGGLERAVAKLGKIGLAAPALELSASKLARAREAVQRLVDVGLVTKGQLRGFAGPTPVEVRIKRHQAVDAAMNRMLKEAHRAHRRSGGTLSRTEFLEEIGRAMRRNDQHRDPSVARAAQGIRQSVFDPFLKEAQARGLVPEDIDVKTAPSYFSRVYDREAIRARLPQFKDRVETYLRRVVPRSELEADAEYGEMASDIINQILGNPGGRIPFATIRDPKKRGALKERTFNIPDEEIEEFLVSDVQRVASRYIRTLAADIEMTRAFGRPDPGEALAKEIIEEAQERAALSPRDARGFKSERARKKALDDAERQADLVRTLTQRIRGTDGQAADPRFQGLKSVSKAARDLNFMRLLGGVTLSSVPDFGRIVATEGLTRSIGPLLLDLGRGLKGLKMAKREAQLAGTALELMRSQRIRSVFDLGEAYEAETGISRMLDQATQKFADISGINLWNTALKSWTSMVVGTRVLETAEKLAKGQRLSARETRKLARSGISPEMAERIAAQSENWQRESGVIMANTEAWNDPAAVEAFRDAVLRDVDNTIITPGAGDAPLWTSNDFGKTVFQFKRFAAASMQRILLSGLQERDMAQLAGLMTLLGMGALVNALKDIASEGEVKERTAREWTVDAVDRSGVLSLFVEGDALLGKLVGRSLAQTVAGREPRRFVSRDVLAQAFGPTAGLVEDVAAATRSALEDDFTASDLRKLRYLIPGQNVFYLRFLADALERGVAQGLSLPDKQPRDRTDSDRVLP